MVGDFTHEQIPGTVLSSDFATIYTVPSTKTAISLRLWFTNIGLAQRLIRVFIVTAGGSPGSAGMVVAPSSTGSSQGLPRGGYLDPGESRGYRWDNIPPSSYVVAMVDGGSDVNVRGGVALKQTV